MERLYEHWDQSNCVWTGVEVEWNGWSIEINEFWMNERDENQRLENNKKCGI